MKNEEKQFGSGWRRQLLAHAHGEVLELFVGEGSNFKYYPAGVHVTATDISARIIEIAKREAAAHGVYARFIVSAFEDLKLTPQSFDTVVNTFSLNACAEPLKVLNRINDLCKPGGDILLLENGLSSCSLIRWLQTRGNHYYYSRTGGRLDHDIKAILETSMVRVKTVERKLGGMIWLVWGTPGFADSVESMLTPGSGSEAA